MTVLPDDRKRYTRVSAKNGLTLNLPAALMFLGALSGSWPADPLCRRRPAEDDTQFSWRRTLGVGGFDHQKAGAVGADVIGCAAAAAGLKLTPEYLSRPIDRAVRFHGRGHHPIGGTIEQLAAVTPPERFRSTPGRHLDGLRAIGS